MPKGQNKLNWLRLKENNYYNSETNKPNVYKKKLTQRKDQNINNYKNSKPHNYDKMCMTSLGLL